MKRDHKPIKDIIILSAGNLNVGDHAILCSWLHFYRKLFGAHARITILGAEASYIAEQTCDLPCKVLVSNILHRYVWEHYEEKNHARVQNAVADLVETDRMTLGTDLQRLKKAKLDQVMKMIGLERDWFWMRRVMDRI